MKIQATKEAHRSKKEGECEACEVQEGTIRKTPVEELQEGHKSEQEKCRQLEGRKKSAGSDSMPA